MSLSQKQLDELCVNTLRMLSADAVQQAESGHPGLPLGAAAMSYVLWTKFLRFNPCNTRWPNRDRYIHSAGHGSALLYSLLHMTGCDLSLDDVKQFRQWQSKTPGHPEYDPELGVEATTGPLGQGFGMGVGMAIAERFLAAKFNRPGFPIVDHYTYAIVSDGDLMEGVASEAASLAGHHRLGKLIYLYDDNHITIEGDTGLAFTEDVEGRFRAYGWQVLRVSDGNDVEAIEAAIRHAQTDTQHPSLIMVRTRIGYGSPKQDSASAHGEPLGEEALKATKEYLNWPLEPRFHIPEEALLQFRLAVDRGRDWEQQWLDLFAAYQADFREEAESLQRQFRCELPADWEAEIPVFKPDAKGMATRVASGKVLNGIAARVSYLLGGSADLAPSTKTLIAGSGDQSSEDPAGRNLRFGVREHGMGAIVNGMALHGGVIPYGSTFLIFSDYLRPSLRVAALMDVHSIFVFTHDSIAVGEDGPTHQPVEHVLSLRAIPNFTVIRPADANETAVAWKVAMTRPKPVALILSRQNLPTIDRTRYASADGLYRGAYVVSDAEGDPDALLVATGSEVTLALQAQESLAEKNIRVRVVSMPSWELFAEQPQDYREGVFPPAIRVRLAVEAGSGLGWAKWVGADGDIISVDRFGSSAPGSEVMKQYGFTVENVVARVEKLLKR
jgi:transketolase